MRFSRNRRNTFSTPTIASSTSSPMATAIPPRVIVLIDSPIKSNTMNVVSSDSGIAVSVMIVVRKFRRNNARIITTRIAPSRNAATTFSLAFSIKCDWRKRSALTIVPAGRPGRSLSSVSSISEVSLRVSACGCLEIAMMTAGLPFIDPSPRLMGEPASMTRATSLTRMGTVDPSLVRATTSAFSMSAIDRTRPRLRTTSSRFSSAMKPPPEFSLASRTAASSSCNVKS